MLIANPTASPMSDVAAPLLYGLLPLAALYVAHSIIRLIIKSKANLTAADPDDSNRSMQLMGFAAERLYAEKFPELSNLL